MEHNKRELYKSPQRGETINNTVQAEGVVPWLSDIRKLRPEGTRQWKQINRTHPNTNPTLTQMTDMG